MHSVSTEPLPRDTPHVPVAIVGAGSCGLVAALMLREAGVDCVVLERDAQPSGSTALSSGFIPAAGTLAQKKADVQDSVTLFAADIQAKAKAQAATHLVASYVDSMPAILDFLQEKHGFDWQVLDGFLYPGHSVRRMHSLPEKTGAALMARLQNAASSVDVDLLTQAQVSCLHVDAQQRITGLTYTRPDGSLETLRCDALILACNGFGGNAEMVRELLPEMAQATFAGHVGNDGSAIAWGRALGARLADLQGYQGHGSWVIPQGILMSWAVMMQGGMQLNAQGQRFHDETQGYSEAAVHVLQQPGGIAWNVMDEGLLALARSFPDFVQAEQAGALRKADTRESLAALIGCTAESLSADLARLQAPYYAVKVTGALFHTQGGLDIDAQCRVLNASGEPFPNLLAAGGAARGVSGNAVWGYLSGNGLLSAVAGGALAAKTARLLVANL